MSIVISIEITPFKNNFKNLKSNQGQLPNMNTYTIYLYHLGSIMAISPVPPIFLVNNHTRTIHPVCADYHYQKKNPDFPALEYIGKAPVLSHPRFETI